jgi:hypothetical protein
VVRIQSGKEDLKEKILPFKSTTFRHKLVKITLTTISNKDGEHINMGLINLALKRRTLTKSQASTKEELRQFLIKQHSLSPIRQFLLQHRVKIPLAGHLG